VPNADFAVRLGQGARHTDNFGVDPKIFSFSTGIGVTERYPTRHVLDDLRRKMVFVG
jgi:hypothetical protein